MQDALMQLFVRRNRDRVYRFPPYHPGADFEWIRTQSKLPYLHLDIPVPADQIQAELDSIAHLFVDHRDDYGQNHGWQSFCIHGKSYDATREDSHYNDTRPHAWTREAVDLMPNTVSFFQNHWPGTGFRRVRVMKLAAGGYIFPHVDGEQTGLQAINIAITQPKDCWFVFDQIGTVPFQVGSAFCLDIANRHAVWNQSDQDRYHIIVHQNLQDPHLQKIVVDSYHLLYNTLDENS